MAELLLVENQCTTYYSRSVTQSASEINLFFSVMFKKLKRMRKFPEEPDSIVLS